MDELRQVSNSPIPAINFSDDQEFRGLQDDINKVQSEIDTIGGVNDNSVLLAARRA